MDYNTIERSRKNIAALLDGGRVKEAIDGLRALAREAANGSIIDGIDAVEQSYRYMLQYAADGVSDPERGKIYDDIVVKLKEIVDVVVNELVAKTSPKLYYSTLRVERMRPESLDTLVSRYSDALEAERAYAELPEAERDAERLAALREAKENVANAIFKKVWTAYPVMRPGVDSLRALVSNQGLPETLRQQAVSAVMMNLLEHYSELLLLVLVDLYLADRGRLGLKALCCALIVMYKYRGMISRSRELQLRLSGLADDSRACADIMMIFLQFIRSRTTERITKKVQTELVPELMKLKPELRNKLQGIDAEDDPEAIAANPDWQEMLDKSGITAKMLELNKMQMEGGDVFLSSFARLKSFPFFYDIANWFVPFTMDSSVVTRVLKSSKGKLMEMVDHSGVFCDNDKYSFVLSLSGLPEDRRVVMLGQFDEQSGAMAEMAKAELPEPEKERENTVNKFVQNLYRFFNLFSRRAEFYNPFAGTLNLIEVPFVSGILSDTANLELVAEFYFKQELYADAASLFVKLREIKDADAGLYQKLGFCYERMKDYRKAVENYEKVDLIKPDDVWTLKRMASCRRAVGDVEGALDCYKRLEVLQPDNISVANSIGNCHLELGDVKEALKYYFKVDYLSGNSVKTMRPIAWCSFLDGNYSQSIEYYDKILALKRSPGDYINHAHVLLASGRVKEAVEDYGRAASMSGVGKVSETMEADMEYLLAAGVDRMLICLILDKLRYDNRS